MKKPSWLSSALRPPTSLPKKTDLGDTLQGFYGQHRSGWPYVLQLQSRLQTANGIHWIVIHGSLKFDQAG